MSGMHACTCHDALYTCRPACLCVVGLPARMQELYVKLQSTGVTERALHTACLYSLPPLVFCHAVQLLIGSTLSGC